MIRSPYNFVPVSDKVFFPDWADQISHDIPFSDGVSGSLELTITAKTPLFVRNGHTKEDARLKSTNYQSFSKVDGRYFIPSTSIKGSIRSIMEILTFGKMSRINDKRYSIRDLNLKKYMEHFQNNQIHCGWMSLKDNEIEIIDNGIPYRISYAHLDEKWGTDFQGMCTDPDRFKRAKSISAVEMYSVAGTNSLKEKFKEYKFSSNPVDIRKMVNFSEDGYDGTIVFTGQPGIRKNATKFAKASGKNFQFVFLNKIIGEYKLDYMNENSIFQDFCFVYKDSEIWNYWRPKFENGEGIPVFFSLENGQVKHIGLSYLYKLPYPNKISAYMNHTHREMKRDMADCIFGNVIDGEDIKESLKGRVLFTHAFYDKNQGGGIMDEPLAVYMSSPKPTYYPIYLSQKGINGSMVDAKGTGIPFVTMLDSKAQLKGWKRYPIRQEAVDTFEIPKGQEDNANTFQPMQKGSVFKGRVFFHNLRKLELGALLRSIEINENSFHSIGFAKPYGYGVVDIKVDSVSIMENGISMEDCKKDFLELMKAKIENYTSSRQLKELYKMTSVQQVYSPLEYMDLKEFVEYKKQHFKKDKRQCFGEYLLYYSELTKPVVVSKKNNIEVCEATVTFWDKSIKKAKLLLGKDLQPKLLDMNGEKIKLKVNDKIEVVKIMKGSNVEKLKFKRKL